MKPLILFFGLIYATMACSTLPAPTVKNISLQDLENLRTRAISTVELRKLFGDPIKIVAMSLEDEVWVYENPETTMHRATFWISKVDSNAVLSALWIPSQTDSIRTEATALQHFEGVAFKKIIPKAVGHARNVDEYFYENVDQRITIAVRNYTKGLASISFTLPASPLFAKK